ncbi:MAG: lipid-transfer protein [Polaromonas sp. 39-63-203]|uniref:lipid-transfer protein n=1 Tax=Polaromonas sp. TaxID=1869339 RepID=UPI000BCE7E7A|nr:lipid-transfer protein [Polaromonas sp.]OYY51950.1 MAG: lipid-transfer protein [Polaromonas sp. 35-63-240]OYY99330.1 MAG: lipid-transfer protein [Polaromonas sp. 28-63-22]OYZ83753.1 MAG: lipid-transfer protein [Polaromonas sp. 24-62-144]OZA97114.1 MAG: lipid-transfer protein [Polaromonas sp. 39-63-203]HQS32495.1 lipid-transfer protein [Polaromonas sp.]
MTRDVWVAGSGMIPFTKPGASPSYDVMGAQAMRSALADAHLDYAQVQQVYAGYVYGDSCSGQRAAYAVGLSGVPVFNVNNNCSTGSTALFLARQAVASGSVDCALAVGFEQMKPGALGSVYDDRPTPFDRFEAEADALLQVEGVPLALRYFGGAGLAHMQQYGTQLSTFANIRAKASRHAANNPLALFRQVLTEQDVLNAPVMWPGVMTRLMACPPTCGGAAAIVCSDAFAQRHGLDRSVRIRAQAMTTDTSSTFEAHDMRQLVGVDMTRDAAQQVYAQAGVGPQDIQVVELHDCFAHNELLTYEALSLCADGEAEKFVLDGDNTYGGRFVTNPSGGLLSKGHPLGATGLAQCHELVQQLRGTADKRQVEGARLALQHNLGLGGACVVTLYERV